MGAGGATTVINKVHDRRTKERQKKNDRRTIGEQNSRSTGGSQDKKDSRTGRERKLSEGIRRTAGRGKARGGRKGEQQDI